MSQPATVERGRLVGEMRPGQRLVAASCLVLLVALFLDWISVSCTGDLCGTAGTAGGSGFHGWGWLTFLALLATAALLLGRTVLRATVTLPALPAPDAVLLMALGGLELLGCLLFWLEYHDAFTSVSAGGVRVSVGPGVGWFLAVLAGVGTVLGGQLDRTPQAPPPAPVPPGAR